MPDCSRGLGATPSGCCARWSSASGRSPPSAARAGARGSALERSVDGRSGVGARAAGASRARFARCSRTVPAGRRVRDGHPLRPSGATLLAAGTAASWLLELLDEAEVSAALGARFGDQMGARWRRLGRPAQSRRQSAVSAQPSTTPASSGRVLRSAAALRARAERARIVLQCPGEPAARWSRGSVERLARGPAAASRRRASRARVLVSAVAAALDVDPRRSRSACRARPGAASWSGPAVSGLASGRRAHERAALRARAPARGSTTASRPRGKPGCTTASRAARKPPRERGPEIAASSRCTTSAAATPRAPSSICAAPPRTRRTARRAGRRSSC